MFIVYVSLLVKCSRHLNSRNELKQTLLVVSNRLWYWCCCWWWWWWWWRCEITRTAVCHKNAPNLGTVVSSNTHLFIIFGRHNEHTSENGVIAYFWNLPLECSDRNDSIFTSLCKQRLPSVRKTKFWLKVCMNRRVYITLWSLWQSFRKKLDGE